MKERIIQTRAGLVRGQEKNGLLEFLGIPYAERPIGPLRFKRAVPKAPWDGVLDALAYGPVPVQRNEGTDMGSEDCLTVNVRRPVEGEKLPVFVWIYGGGYNTGSASDALYHGEAFARDGLVFVSFQYRLNVLGFYDFSTYTGCEDLDTNCGLSDQILALKWVHENIAAFGGDPEKVTIAGESAGGASVVTLMAAPGARGYFQQAIAESALPNCVMTHACQRMEMDLFLEGMGWTEEDLPRLRTEDPYRFLDAVDYMSMRFQEKEPGRFLPGPVLDDLLPQRPIDAIRAGSAAGVKLIIGTNQHEATMFLHPEGTVFPNAWSMVARMLESCGHADAIPDMVDFYRKRESAGPENGDTRQAGEDPFIRFGTDYAFEMPSIKVALGQRRHTPDVWMYRLELLTRGGAESGWKVGHAFELPAVFDCMEHPFSHFVFDGEAPELFEALVAEIHGDWVRFAKTGEPNADWNRFEGADSYVRIFDRVSRTERLDRRALLRIWGDMRFYEN